MEAKQLLEELNSKKKTSDDVNASQALRAIKSKVIDLQSQLKDSSRTAALWIQYLEMVDILRNFIKAERTANWPLHLQTLHNMLPYLAASGHNLYVKSAWLYLQAMEKLETDDPRLHQHFMGGFHVVRRSNRYWAGLSTDLVIEQVLMRSLKTSGGLTRGRGMTERQRLTWLLSRPACAEISDVIQELTGVYFNSSEQNKDASKARMERDMKDTLSMLEVLSEQDPFVSTPESLRNIMNGINAEERVNVDTAKEIGNKILKSMVDKTPEEYTFKRCSMAITLGTASTVRIDSEEVQIDPQLLFQRLVLACNTTDDMKHVFEHELCTYPTSLFEGPAIMRPANKPALADALWAMVGECTEEPRDAETQYVLDGGALIHRCPWPTTGTATNGQICDNYCKYVRRRYGQPVIVFDGYSTITTKNMTQKRRSANKISPTVTLSEDLKATIKKERFLSNGKNKEQLIKMLCQKLSKNGCTTLQADGDADVLIATTAVKLSEGKRTILVGDDTDLLVLVLYHYNLENHELLFRPEPKTKSTTSRVWAIKSIKSKLGEDICTNILFIHSFLGCDTTSRIFGLGKGNALKKFIDAKYFREQALIFNGVDECVERIAQAGEKALVSLLNGKRNETLDDLRYRKYYEKLASRKAQITAQSLPPTSAALKYHSMRVYLQIRQWKDEDGSQDLSEIQKWGWKIEDLQDVIPIMSDKAVAPDALLKIIRCNCSSDCSSRRCTCRKNGFDCSPACGQCKGTSCLNCPKEEEGSDDVDTTNM